MATGMRPRTLRILALRRVSRRPARRTLDRSHASHPAPRDFGAPSPRAPRPRRGARPRRGRAPGLGVAGRVAIHAGGHVPHGEALAALGRAFVALGGPWLAAAWTVGALAGSRRRGALGAGAALALGTAAWYLLTVAAGGRAAMAYAVPVAAAWAGVALAAGALFGVAGASSRDGEPRARPA